MVTAEICACLQILENFLQFGRGQLDRLDDSLFKSQNSFSHVLDLAQIIEPR
jgi:hypothetical protein